MVYSPPSGILSYMYEAEGYINENTWQSDKIRWRKKAVHVIAKNFKGQGFFFFFLKIETWRPNSTSSVKEIHLLKFQFIP